MGKKDRLERYRMAVFNDALAWMDDAVVNHLEAWCAEDAAMAIFGPGADVLDTLFLMKRYADAIPFALAHQVRAALEEGHSWNEISAALGVSRQAAVKRFGWVA